MTIHDIQFPNESHAYRRSRNGLLEAEIDLRKSIEKVARLRRELPLGGEVKEDYEFEEGSPDLTDTEFTRKITLSQLFGDGKRTLIIYSFMYGDDMQRPCPSCSSILDGINGLVHHATQLVNFCVAAKSPIQRIRDCARDRRWHRLRLLSSMGNGYNVDYHAESESGNQIPAINVFTKTPTGVFHSYNAELLYSEEEEGQDPRHADLLWPLWNLLDLTPEGRGVDWYPSLSY